jgi:hypothetical protein
VLFLIAQMVMATFDQRLNLETSQNPVFVAAKIIYLAGFIVLMFALIAVYGLQGQRAGRLGVAAFLAVAVLGIRVARTVGRRPAPTPAKGSGDGRGGALGG